MLRTAITSPNPILAKSYLVVILVDGHLKVAHHEVIGVDARTPATMLFSIILVTCLAGHFKLIVNLVLQPGVEYHKVLSLLITISCVLVPYFLLCVGALVFIQSLQEGQYRALDIHVGHHRNVPVHDLREFLL